MNISTILETSARKYPEKVAIIFEDKTYTYSYIDNIANQVANGLKSRGIGPGDKVALSCLNIPHFPIIYYGILKTGAIVVPLSVLLKSEEVTYHLNDSNAKAYFCFEGTADLPMGKYGEEGFNASAKCERMIVIPTDPSRQNSMDQHETFQQLIERQINTFESEITSPDSTALIIYTSGTTGKPKGAQLTHNNLFMNAALSADIFKTTSSDKQLIVLPLFHIFGMTCLMNAGIYRGAGSVLLPRFDGKTVIELFKKHSITLFAGVPTMYWGLLNTEKTNEDIRLIQKHLRIAVSGGASLPHKVLSDFEAIFKVPLLEGYGMSEGSPVVTFNQTEMGTKPNSIGTPMWGVQVKLVDNDGNEVPVGEKGELIYKGHNVMKGYYQKPNATAESLKDGWLYSGDIAIKDEDGFFFIVDRKKDMIIRGGLNVYPREIEEVMMMHPAISMVAVIGVLNDKLGEEVKAFVQLKPDMEATPAEIISWTKEKVAAYKYPRQIEIIDTLPTSATGKILKKDLRKQ